MSKGYWISVYEKIEDSKILSEYAKKATIAIQGHQGNFLCRGVEQLPTTAERPYVCILHYHLSPWVRAFRASGFARVVAILPIREPMANVRSMMVRGHRTEFEDGYRYRTVTIARNIVEALAQDVQLEIITYEGLTEPFLAGWLPRIGLPYVPGNLSLPGQHTSNEICNQNAKHYS